MICWNVSPFSDRPSNKSTALLKDLTDWSLIEEMMRPESESRIDRTDIAQPMIFASAGRPNRAVAILGSAARAVVGHSVGEVAAAYVAGIYSLADAVKVSVHRGSVATCDLRRRPDGGRGRFAGRSGAGDRLGCRPRSRRRRERIEAGDIGGRHQAARGDRRRFRACRKIRPLATSRICVSHAPDGSAARRARASVGRYSSRGPRAFLSFPL